MLCLRALRGHLAADLLADLLPALRLSEESEAVTYPAALPWISSVLSVRLVATQRNRPMLSNGPHGLKDRLGELDKQIAVSEAAAKANGEVDFTIRRKKRLFADLKGITPALRI